MRKPRLKLEGRSAVYHCISQVAGGQPLLDAESRDMLVHILWAVADFCGLQVLTYCMMPDHVHLLLRVPEGLEVTDRELLRRLAAFYGPRAPVVREARKALTERGRVSRALRQTMLERMGDVSLFMKEFKQRFSRWYNRRSGRAGTLWAARFKSVLVEDNPAVLQTLAAYIDLNPVRAGLVSDAKDYPFCGYAAARGGHQKARAGLKSCLAAGTWTQAERRYRHRWLAGAETGKGPSQASLDRNQIKQALAKGQPVSPGQALRLHVRHMSDGAVIGSKAFVDEVFELNREMFGPKRKSGARPIRGVPLEELSVLRDLRVKAVS